MARPLTTKQLIARDVSTPKWIVQRPVKRETLAQIVAIANQVSLIKQGKREAKSFIRGMDYAHPSAPREQPTLSTNWQRRAKASDRALARLVAPPRRSPQ